MIRSSEASVNQTEAPAKRIDGAAGANTFFYNTTAAQTSSRVKTHIVNLLFYVFEVSPLFARPLGHMVLWAWPGMRER